MNRRFLTVLASLTLLASAAFAQTSAPNTRVPMFGLHPPTPKLIDDASTAATSTVYGTLEYSFTIQLSTPFMSSGSEVSCGVTVAISDAGSGREFTEDASAPATISGKTAKCTVTIPYQWVLATASTDKINASYEIGGFTGEVTGDSDRTAGSNLPSISVPANGAIISTGVIARL